MTQNTRTQSIDNLVRPNTPQGIKDQLSKQIDRGNDATNRISKEGIVVRDTKGSIIQHPAIKIELLAGKMIVDILKKYGKKE